jgi:hypothetical protein
VPAGLLIRDEARRIAANVAKLIFAERQLMADPEVEAAWRAEFERIGETQLRDTLNSGGVFTDEPKTQAAFRWLGDEAQAWRLREEKTYHYVRGTFIAAIARVIVGLIGVGLTLLH